MTNGPGKHRTGWLRHSREVRGGRLNRDDGSPSSSSRRSRPGAAQRRYYVYVVELDDAVGPRRNPRYPSVYVGQSVVPPAERLRQHKDGYRSSRYVRKHGRHLRPGLYRRFNPMATRDEAVAMEQELARRLRNRGYTVYGGH